jgi:hypothetical protein
MMHQDIHIILSDRPMHVLAWVSQSRKYWQKSSQITMKIKDSLKKRSNLINLIPTAHNTARYTMRVNEEYWNIVDKLSSLSIMIQRLLLMINDWWGFDMKVHHSQYLEIHWWTDHSIRSYFWQHVKSHTHSLWVQDYCWNIEPLSSSAWKTIKAMTVESEARMSHQDLSCLHQQLVIHNSSSSYWNHRSTIGFTLRTTLTFLYSFIISYFYVIECRFALAHFVQICEHELALC